jgi:hypothetical protein
MVFEMPSMMAVKVEERTFALTWRSIAAPMLFDCEGRS